MCPKPSRTKLPSYLFKTRTPGPRSRGFCIYSQAVLGTWLRTVCGLLPGWSVLCHGCLGGKAAPKGALCPLQDPASQPWATRAGSTDSPGLVQPEGGLGAKLRTCQEFIQSLSDGYGASFQKPLIIQRNSLSVHLFLLSLPMHSSHIHHIQCARTNINALAPHTPRCTPCHLQCTYQMCKHTHHHTALGELSTQLHIPHTHATYAPHRHTDFRHHTHTHHTTYCMSTLHVHMFAYLHAHRNTGMQTQTHVCVHTAVSISHPDEETNGASGAVLNIPGG